MYILCVGMYTHTYINVNTYMQTLWNTDAWHCAEQWYQHMLQFDVVALHKYT